MEVKVSLESELRKYIKNNNVATITAHEIMRTADPYVPFKTGVLKNTATVTEERGKVVIKYDTPYARYQWFGKLMVDPITKKGAFYSPKYGFWSRPHTPKELTNRDLQYVGAPKKGAFWVERAWQENKQQIISKIEAKL